MEKRKFISLFLCLSLLASLTLMPAAAFAAEVQPSESTLQAEPVQENTAQTEPSVQTQAAESAPAVPAETSAGQASEQAPATEPAAVPSSDEQTDIPQQLEDSTAPPAQSTDEDPAEPADVQAEEPEASQESAAQAASEPSAPVKKSVATAEKTVNGIKVTGGIEGKDWTYDSKEKTLTISKDGMTVSGTATDNLIILCTLAVSSLTLDNLDHGKKIVEIISGEAESEKTDFNLTLKGSNKISAITGSGDVTITGEKNSRLDLTAGLNALNDLNIKNAVVTGGIFAADRDINITGTSQVTAKPTKELTPALELGLPVSMMTAGRNINIDLAPGGSVAASGIKTAYADVLPMLAMGRINISDNSKVILPQNGKVGTSDVFDILPVQLIVDSSGNPASDVLIQHISAQNSTAAGSAFAAAASGSVSPQTGDNSTSALLILYLILTAAGSTAIALRMAQKRRCSEIMR